MPDRNGFPLFGRSRQIASDRVVYFDLSVFYQSHDGGCSELFGYRGQFEDGVRSCPYIKFEVGEPVAAYFYGHRAFYHREGEPGDLARPHLILNVAVDRIGLRPEKYYAERIKQKSADESQVTQRDVRFFSHGKFRAYFFDAARAAARVAWSP